MTCPFFVTPHLISCTHFSTLPLRISVSILLGVDPFEELLLGPTFACLNVLNQLKLQLSDIGVIEFHEAFAGQVLANMTAMASDKFAQERFPGEKERYRNLTFLYRTIPCVSVCLFV